MRKQRVIIKYRLLEIEKMLEDFMVMHIRKCHQDYTYGSIMIKTQII